MTAVITIADQHRFLRAYRDTDRRIRCGQELTLRDRELIHMALTMVYTVLSADIAAPLEEQRRLRWNRNEYLYR